MVGFGTRNRRDAITSRFRLRNYDYSTPGLYFVTVCTEGRVTRFGRVVDDVMIPNDPGQMVSDLWFELSIGFPGVMVDAWVTMPNHVHALIGIGLEQPEVLERPTLPDVMHWYKSKSTNLYIKGVKTAGWPRFDRRLWQPGYHEHIVRDDRDLDRIRDYIEGNPANWQEDVFNR
jgi:putative transposase